MSFTFDIPLDTAFFLFFVGGFFAGFIVLWMMIDYARMRAEYAEKYNCMGIRRPTAGRKAPPLPMHPPKK